MHDVDQCPLVVTCRLQQLVRLLLVQTPRKLLLQQLTRQLLALQLTQQQQEGSSKGGG
jgi:hypothetical protein